MEILMELRWSNNPPGSDESVLEEQKSVKDVRESKSWWTF